MKTIFISDAQEFFDTDLHTALNMLALLSREGRLKFQMQVMCPKCSEMHWKRKDEDFEDMKTCCQCSYDFEITKDNTFPSWITIDL